MPQLLSLWLWSCQATIQKPRVAESSRPAASLAHITRMASPYKAVSRISRQRVRIAGVTDTFRRHGLTTLRAGRPSTGLALGRQGRNRTCPIAGPMRTDGSEKVPQTGSAPNLKIVAGVGGLTDRLTLSVLYSEISQGILDVTVFLAARTLKGPDNVEV